MERPKLSQRNKQVIQEKDEYKTKLDDLENQNLTDIIIPGDPLENEFMVKRLENSKKFQNKYL
jgi:hypothetical protein